MNKKLLAGLLAIIMILALVLVGCSKKPGNTPSGQQSLQPGNGVEDWDEVNPGVGNSSGQNSGQASGSNSQSGSQSGSQSSGSSSSSSSASGKEDYGMTLEEYNSMSPKDQQAYFESFDSVEDYWAWYDAAKADYDAKMDGTHIEGDGNFDITDHIK